MKNSGRHLVYMVSEYLPAVGGTTTQIRNESKEAIRRGWKVSILTRRLENVAESNVTIEGAQIRRLGIPGNGQIAKLSTLLSAWWWLVRRRKRVSIVNAILEADFAIIAIAAGMGRRTTLTWATRGDATYWLTGLTGRLRSWLLRRCQQVALTALMQLELEQLGQAITKVIAVPVDVTRFTPPTKVDKIDAKAALGLEDRHLIVFSGHLERRKGVDVLLRAFALLREKRADTSLIILGGERPNEGAYAQSLRQVTQDYGLNDSALFFGVVEDVLPFLRAADLFCLPSWREGMPNAIIEAMACGLTCVAPASAGGDELLYENAGIIPASNSPEDLAAAMELALGDEGLRERIGEEAVRRVRLNYTVTQVMDLYEDIWT